MNYDFIITNGEQCFMFALCLWFQVCTTIQILIAFVYKTKKTICNVYSFKTNERSNKPGFRQPPLLRIAAAPVCATVCVSQQVGHATRWKFADHWRHKRWFISPIPFLLFGFRNFIQDRVIVNYKQKNDDASFALARLEIWAAIHVV